MEKPVRDRQIDGRQNNKVQRQVDKQSRLERLDKTHRENAEVEKNRQ